MGKHITVCAVTRNKSITVSTLHMLLTLSGHCFSNGFTIHIHFVEGPESFGKLVKTNEKILWVSYGCSLDQESFDTVLHSTHDALVFPVVLEGVHWNLFKNRLESIEPIHQRALEFDTTVSTKLSDGFWVVKTTNPSVFLVDCKSVEKKMRTRKGEGIKLPLNFEDLFKKFQENGMKCVAYTKANVIVHRHHECVGNIMENASVKWVKNDGTV